MNRPRTVLLFWLVAAALGGCGGGGLAGLSSGRIGCPEDDITITDDHGGYATRNWTAHCHGRTYYCSAHRSANPYSSAQIACTESDSDAREDSVESAPAGCQHDNQCKGDRVCVHGSCVDPGSTGGDRGAP